MQKKRRHMFYILRWGQEMSRMMVGNFLDIWAKTMNAVDKKSVYICRIKLKIENGMSSTQTVEYALIVNQLGNVQDLKFVDDEKLMLVMSQDGK